jgi:NYN domain
VARTIVYIDGFNLYYRALKGTAHKWLDIAAMSRAALPATCQIEAINYYTAHISGRVDPEAPKRQHAYLRAIATLPKVAVHYGNFLVNQKWAGLVQPPEFRPQVTLPASPTPEVAYVWKTEEKGSDVNLGVHLVRDAFKGRFDLAAVLTNDTDLVEPIRIVTQELGLPVTLLTPSAQPAVSLTNVATSVRHIRPYVGPCQLPNLVLVPGKRPIAKPARW